MTYDKPNNIQSMSAQEFIELIQVTLDLKEALASGTQVSDQELTNIKPILSKLLEYMILKMDENNVDMELVAFLEKLLGIKYNRQSEKEKSRDREEEREEEVSEKVKQHRFRMAMYEIHKILNPNRLAGESSLDNFINNVRTRGVGVAREYEGAEYVHKFKNRDLEALESHKESFVAALRDGGYKGGGRGL